MSPKIKPAIIGIITPKTPQSLAFREFKTKRAILEPTKPITPSTDKSILPINNTKVKPVARVRGTAI